MYCRGNAGNSRGVAEQAIELIDEAERAGRLLTATNPQRTQADIYRVGVHTALGDSSAALQAADFMAGMPLPTVERKARLAFDSARAWYQQGNFTRCFQALQAAERYAPEDIRRPSAKLLVHQLLDSPKPTPQGLPDLARRIGVLDEKTRAS